MARKKINPNDVEKLAQIGASLREMSIFLNVSIRTLERRLAEPKYEKARDQGEANLNISIRRKQIELALGGKGDKTMLIWLGKQILGQQDKIEQITEIAGELNLGIDPIDEIRSRIARIVERRGAGGSPQRTNGHASGETEV